MRITRIFMVAAALAAVVSCTENQPVLTKSGLSSANFTSQYEGKYTSLYTLTNDSGMEVCITNFGGRIVSVMVPDKDGNFIDVVHGFESVAGYFPENNETDFGAAIGRYANRINHGLFMLDSQIYQLPLNNFGHCLHGGPTGWQYQVYSCVEVDPRHVKLCVESPDGDNGFPGDVSAYVTYTLTDDNAIDIKYDAVTSMPTIINMTNHSYFKLAGDNTDGDIGDNLLYINASNFTPVDSTFMTTGEILPVAGTPMDFTAPKRLADVWDQYDFEQIKFGRGIDHNWVLDTEGDITKVAASVYAPSTGIKLEVYTNEPGIQIYSGNFLDATVIGKFKRIYEGRTAICFETQKYPDSPNKPEWPSPVVRPGETYNSHCIYKFSVE